MFVYGAIGDAYGAAFEFLDYDRFHPNTGKAYYEQPDTGLGLGKYTDDTQMHAAVGSVMLANPKTMWTAFEPNVFADAFVEFYHRDPRPGYAMGFKGLLESCENGNDLLTRIEPKSKRSGAIMRVACVGGYPKLEKVLQTAAIQAAITHNTPEAIECAQAIALAAHYLIHIKGPRNLLRQFINATLPVDNHAIDWTVDRTGWATVDAVDCARNALTAWYHAETVTECLTLSVAQGGDTDTVASIAMSLAWADKSLKDDLHPTMTEGLEQGDYGFPYLFDMSNIFYERFCK